MCQDSGERSRALEPSCFALLRPMLDFVWMYNTCIYQFNIINKINPNYNQLLLRFSFFFFMYEGHILAHHILIRPYFSSPKLNTHGSAITISITPAASILLSRFSNILYETTWPIELELHSETHYDGRVNVCSDDPCLLNKMASTVMYVKDLF